jgi:hypothetical protein
MSERKSCHNCRRRRLRCDRSVPACYKCTKTGQRCLGYGQIYRWVDSETSSGHESQRRGASLTSSAECDSLLLRRAYHGELSDLSTLNTLGDGPQEPLNSFLADPLLQDLSASNRRYMFYCTCSTLLAACRQDPNLPNHRCFTILPGPRRP